MLGTMSAQTIRFPVTPVSSLVVSDLYFPLASAPAAFWSAVRSDGGDIRVFAQDGITRLPIEVSGFDYVNKTGHLWIGRGSATACYIACGTGESAPAADAAYGSRAAWEGNAKAVYHCSDAASPLLDSTSSQNNLIESGALLHGQTGKIGTCIGGISNRYASSAGAAVTGDVYSMAGWFFSDASSGTMYCLSRYTAAGQYDAIGRFSGRWIAFNGTTVLNGPTFETGKWHRVVFVRNGTNVKLYLNGSLVIDDTLTITYAGGAVAVMGRPDNVDLWWNGPGDEIRFYQRALSADEAAQSYTMQNDPAAFWTVGAAG